MRTHLIASTLVAVAALLTSTPKAEAATPWGYDGQHGVKVIEVKKKHSHYDHRYYGAYPGHHYGRGHANYGPGHKYPHHGRGHYDWHDTSHYDYIPGHFRRHGNHYDYIPGHYRFHRDGHYDYHRSRHH